MVVTIMLIISIITISTKLSLFYSAIILIIFSNLKLGMISAIVVTKIMPKFVRISKIFSKALDRIEEFFLLHFVIVSIWYDQQKQNNTIPKKNKRNENEQMKFPM